jgi:hypothetical protein
MSLVVMAVLDSLPLEYQVVLVEQELLHLNFPVYRVLQRLEGEEVLVESINLEVLAVLVVHLIQEM